MSIIKCPECGKEISDKSPQYIHCGYPIKKIGVCTVNGVEYDLSEILSIAVNNDKIRDEERANALNKVKELTNLKNPGGLYYIMVQEKKVPEVYNAKTVPTKTNNMRMSDERGSGKPLCPRCGSTDIRRRQGLVNSKIGLYEQYYICYSCMNTFRNPK